MPFIGPRASISDRPHRLVVQNPDGAPVADGAGSYTQAYADAVPPTLYARVTSASASDMERLATGTVLAMATHIVAGPYHPQITTASRLRWYCRGRWRVFNVLGPSSPDERGIDHEIQVAEVET